MYTPPLDFQYTIFVTILFKTLFQNPKQTFPFKIKGVGCLEACGQILWSLWPNWLTRKPVAELGELESSWMPHWAVVVWALGFTVPLRHHQPTNPPGPIWRDNNSLCGQWWLILVIPYIIGLYFGGAGLALQGRCTLRFSWEYSRVAISHHQFAQKGTRIKGWIATEGRKDIKDLLNELRWS